jgi:hypothetical protein
MTRYGINLHFKEVITWDGMTLPMYDEALQPSLRDSFTDIVINEDEMNEQDTRHYALHHENIGESYVTTILDSRCGEQDLSELAQSQIHLTTEQRMRLQEIFERNKGLLNGKLGVWPNDKVDLDLKEEATPYHCGRPIRIAHAHIETVKQEAARLCSIRVLEEVYAGEAGPWCAASFVIHRCFLRFASLVASLLLISFLTRRPSA